jgi:hypothetical protein
MTEAAVLAPPSHKVVNHQVENDRAALLGALRIAHVKLRMALHEVEDIGAELKAGRLTPREAMRLCVNMRLDALFPRESDGA